LTVVRSSPTSRPRDAFELATGYVLIMLVIWTANPTQRILFWTALFWIVGVTLLSRRDGNTLGFGVSGFWPSLWVVVAALPPAFLMVLLGRRWGTLHSLSSHIPFWMHVSGYLFWALEQQFILQAYFLLRLLRLLPYKLAAVLVAGVLFSLAHLPNPVLTPLTLIWGIASSAIFLRYRNLYSLGLAHCMLGLAVAVSFPESMSHHMMVGLGYLRFHP
jgi:hypothetical protein